MAMSRLVCAGLLWAICLPGAAVDLPLVGEPVVIQQEEVLVGRTEDWVTNTTVPRFGEDERVVLSLEQRLDVPGGGGCNYVLQVWLDDTPLTEASFRPRLLNKAPSFDLKGTEYHFPWYSRTHTAWMTLFSSNYERDMATGEDDFRLAWDITPFVRPQAPLRIRISYAQKNIPDLLGHPASLAVRDAWLGVARDEDVAALQERALADAVKPREVPIEVALPPDTAPGARAYEVQWASRPESPPAQVAFDDLRVNYTCNSLDDEEVVMLMGDFTAEMDVVSVMQGVMTQSDDGWELVSSEAVTLRALVGQKDEEDE